MAEDRTLNQIVHIGKITAGEIGAGRVARAVVTVGSGAVVTATPPAAPADTKAVAWRYLKVVNTTASTVLTVAINEDPSAAAANPPSAVQWGVGYDIIGGATEVIPITGPLTTIRLKSDTAGTSVLLNLIA